MARDNFQVWPGVSSHGLVQVVWSRYYLASELEHWQVANSNLKYGITSEQVGSSSVMIPRLSTEARATT